MGMDAGMDTQQIQMISGSVETIVFSNEENGFTVLELDCDGELVTAVGEMPGVAEGEELRLTGSYTNHPTFGAQFKVTVCERELPATANAIYKYLASGVIKGIGPGLARRIVDAFGDDTLVIMEQNPERLGEIKGISQTKAAGIAEEFSKIFGIRAVIAYLGRYGVAPHQCVQVFKQWGNLALDVVRENPYRLCEEAVGVDFDTADAIAAALGLEQDSPERLKAGVSYVLRFNRRNGHTCLPQDKLVKTAAHLLGAAPEQVEEAMEEQVTEEELVSVEISGRAYLYLPEMYDAERFVAGRLAMMVNIFPDNGMIWDVDIDLLQAETGMVYAPAQRQAISAALSNGILVLTGGPGTGKTTTLNAIIRLMKKQGEKVYIAAPTGRAAKRVSELTGFEAKTIHRLLEVDFDRSEGVRFKHHEKNPLNCDVVIVDEMSMVDIQLFASLLRGLKLSCKLILVGDTDQLPPVGAGNVLRDIIRSGCVPVVELSEIFRQAAQSLIITNAHAIVNGQMPDLTCRDNDFFFLPLRDYASAAATVADLCKKRLPAAYGFSPLRDIQVLAPGRGGELGTASLNQILQAQLNPKLPGKAEAKIGPQLFRQGDKVMQVRNNYDIEYRKDDGEQNTGIFNGDIGIIEEIDRGEQSVRIRFDDRVATYSFEMVRELELAYAVTVHKSQGSEFEAVILPLMNMQSRLYYRNLLYTAVTRAKRLFIILASRQTVQYMVGNATKSLRYSHLKTFLQQEVQGEHEEG